MLGAVAGLVATIAFAWYAASALSGQDLSRHFTPQGIVAITVAAVFYASIIPISAWAWQRLMAPIGARRSWRELTMIMGLTQIAKYIPGNIAYHVGRAGMASSRGIPSRALAGSMLSETLLSIVAALGVGIAGALLSGPGLRLLDSQSSRLSLAALVVAGVGVGTLLFSRVLPPLARRFAPDQAAVLETALLPDPRTLLAAFGAYVANFAFIGIGVWGMATLLVPGEAHDPFLLGAAFAISWVAGFFTPGAPAGLGIREGLLLLLLAPAYAVPDALAIVIAMRLATMLGDVLCFAGGYLLLLRARSSRIGC